MHGLVSGGQHSNRAHQFILNISASPPCDLFVGAQPSWTVWMVALPLQPCQGGEEFHPSVSQLWGWTNIKICPLWCTNYFNYVLQSMYYIWIHPNYSTSFHWDDLKLRFNLSFSSCLLQTMPAWTSTWTLVINMVNLPDVMTVLFCPRMCFVWMLICPNFWKTSLYLWRFA